MVLGLITFIVLLLVTAFAIVILAFDLFRPDPVVDEEFARQTRDELQLRMGWGVSQPIDGVRGKCNVYETFSKNPEIVDTLQPTSIDEDNPPCLDGHILPLEKVQHMCNQELCLGNTGRQFARGESEEYYRSCGELKPCADPRSTIVFNFSLDNQGRLTDNNFCLTNDTKRVVNCRQADPGDLFMNVETKEFIDPNDTAGIINAETAIGIEAVRIQPAGQTGMCLAISDDKLTPTPVLRECSALEDDGFVWLHLPRVPIPLGLYYPSQLIARQTFNRGVFERAIDDLTDATNDFLEVQNAVDNIIEIANRVVPTAQDPRDTDEVIRALQDFGQLTGRNMDDTIEIIRRIRFQSSEGRVTEFQKVADVLNQELDKARGELTDAVNVFRATLGENLVGQTTREVPPPNPNRFLALTGHVAVGTPTLGVMIPCVAAVAGGEAPPCPRNTAIRSSLGWTDITQ